MRIFLLLTAMVLSFSLSARATVFQDWGSEWVYANEPAEDQLQGIWAGRCVTEADPQTKRAAIYVFKYVEDASTIPPERPSQSYFYSTTRPENYFDNLSGKQAVAVKEVSQWFKQDSWEQANVVGGSMKNSYGGFRRLTRVVNDEFSTVVLLRIEREGVPQVQTMCRFAVKLATTGGTDPIPGGVQILANIAALGSGRYQTPSIAPNVAIQKLEIISDGPRAITMREFMGMLPSGQLWAATQPFTLYPGVPVTIQTIHGASVKVSNFIFTTAGFTRGLRILGHTASEGR